MAFNSDGEIDFIGSNSTTKSYRPDRIQGDVAEPPKWATRDADWGTNVGWQKCQFMKRPRSIVSTIPSPASLQASRNTIAPSFS
jgi:hypothetical protein